MQELPSDAVDSSRALILQSAEEHFRRYGYGKTTMNDIAKASEMSAGNLYRFFPSKADILAAIATRWLGEVESRAKAIVDSNKSSGARLRELVREVHTYTKERFLQDDCVHETCSMVIRERWDIVLEHRARIANHIRTIVTEGTRSGEFTSVDPEADARAIKVALTKFFHPEMVAQCIAEPLDEELEVLLDLALRGLTK